MNTRATCAGWSLSQQQCCDQGIGQKGKGDAVKIAPDLAISCQPQGDQVGHGTDNQSIGAGVDTERQRWHIITTMPQV